ncbi:DNA-binding response regulator [Roseospira marina]|uniref:DNA-binding response regulator n=1 Tax=Roseospira marina TaxID=140057 RepID=A0A5M6IBY0_9PROT|nr:DNA-binding response regulator [Roseospira marina]KAA5605804.1 DNA-binding response regulator [Roseospira marina]MBB4313620.1 CheY-like chemotaxis protein [Roseospira marina]MBB5086782.1 CheY-like chemotaxis protein [Roseospira marina]
MSTPNMVPNADEIEREIEAEFREDVLQAIDTVAVIASNLRAGATEPEAAVVGLRAAVRTLNAQAPTGVLPTVRLVLRRLDEYVGPLETLTEATLSDIEAFASRLEDALDGHLDGADATARMVRELPLKRTFDIDFEVVIPRPVEVLLILRDRVGAHLIERELAACGLRSTCVRVPFDAFEQVFRTRPDLIIAGQEIGEMTGVDLACAFAAMPHTRDIPFALLTSYEMGHPALRDLPPRAGLLKKGPSFGDDLAQALSRFDIL